MECWHCSFPLDFRLVNPLQRWNHCSFGACALKLGRAHNCTGETLCLVNSYIHTYAYHVYKSSLSSYIYSVGVIYIYMCVFIPFYGYIASYMSIIIYQNYGQEVSSWLVAATLSPWTPHLNDMVDRGSSSLPLNKVYLFPTKNTICHAGHTKLGSLFRAL